jgi:hypothetical protein
MQRLARWLGAVLVSFAPVAANASDYLYLQWRKVCFDVRLPAVRDKADLPVCYTYNDIELEDLIVGRFGILEVPVREKLFIVAQLQHYPSLEPGYIQIDGRPPIDLVRTCDQEMCVPKAEIGAGTVEQLKRAKSLLFGSRSPHWRNLIVPLRPHGFAEAFKGPPRHDRTNRFDQGYENWIREVIFRMLAE